MLSIEQTRQQLVLETRRIVRSANRTIRWCAGLRWLTVVLATLLALALFDCLLRREELGMRWLQLLTWLCVASYWGYRWLLPALRFAATPIDLARWIERQRPVLAGQLSTVLELSQIDPRDHRFGSGSFQEAALQQWTQSSHVQSWQAQVDATPVRRSALMFLSVVLLAGLFGIVWPVESGLAFRRTLLPWASNRWPQQDLLQLHHLPDAVGHGAVVALEITDTKPPLPDLVQVQLRFMDADQAEPLVITAQRLGDIAVANLPPLGRDVQVRAIGGDDRSMPWRTVRVLAVPVWNNFRFQVELPEYAQKSTARSLRIPDAQQLNSDGTYHVPRQQLQILAGSRVHFQGELNQSVQAVQLLPESDTVRSDQMRPNVQRSDATQDGSQYISADLEPSGKVVSLQILPSSAWNQAPTARWKFQFQVDQQTRLTSGQDWGIEIQEDQAPVCELDEGLLPSVAVGGQLNLTGLASDDWGLQQVKAKMSFLSRPDIELELPIAIHPPIHECPVRAVWDFQAMAAAQGIAVVPQEQIWIWLEAQDQLGQVGVSQKLRLTVETSARQLELIASKQTALGQKLRELQDAQQSGQLASRQLSQQIARADNIDQAKRQSIQDTLAGVMHLQQSVQEQLFDSQQSVQMQLKQMLEALESNQLTGSEFIQHWQALDKMLQEQAENPARQAWEAASQWQADLQSTNPNIASESQGDTSASRLDTAQSQLLQALQQLVDRLNGQEQFGRLRGQLSAVATAQKALSKKVTDLQVDLSEFGDNVLQSKWSQIADQQLRLASQLENWIGHAQHVIQEFGLSDSQKSRLHLATDVLIDGQAISIAGEAGSSLQSRNWSQSVEHQKRLHSNLQAALKHLGEIDRSMQQSLGFASAESSDNLRQLDQIKQTLGGLVLMQQEIMPQYNTLADRLQQSVEPREFLAWSGPLLQQQDVVKQELQSLLDSIDGLATWDWLGQQILQDLTRAIAATQRQRVNPDAIDAAEGALRKMSLAVESLAQFMQSSQNALQNSKPQDSNGNSTDTDQTEQQWNSPDMVSLILLRNLQQTLQEQTATLSEITDDTRRRIRQVELTRMQRELSVRLEELIVRSQSASASATSELSDPQKEVP